MAFECFEKVHMYVQCNPLVKNFMADQLLQMPYTASTDCDV